MVQVDGGREVESNRRGWKSKRRAEIRSSRAIVKTSSFIQVKCKPKGWCEAMEWHDLIPVSTGSIGLLCGGQDGGSEASVLFTCITEEQTSQVLEPPWAPQAIRPHKPVPMGGPLLPIHHAMNRKLQLTTAKCQRSDVNQGFKYMCDVSGEETRLTTPPGDPPQGYLLLTFKFP